MAEAFGVGDRDSVGFMEDADRSRLDSQRGLRLQDRPAVVTGGPESSDGRHWPEVEEPEALQWSGHVAPDPRGSSARMERGVWFIIATWTLESSVVPGCPAATKGRIVVNGGTSRREEGL